MDLRFPVAIERGVACSFLSLPPRALRRIAGPPVRSPEGYVLDLQVQALLWLIRAMRVPQLLDGDLARARATLDRAGPTLDVAAPRDVGAYDRSVPGGDGPRRARIYVPQQPHWDASPGLVYFHGGGWAVGSIDSHDRTCRALASKARLVVVSVDYRLAPEHPFPAGVEDAIAAMRWVLGNARALSVDPTRVAVGGDSAGGNLAAVVAQALRGEPLTPAFQLLVYPATDMTRSLPSHEHFRDSYFLPRTTADWYLAQYVRDDATKIDPRGSPLFARDLGALPPALVLTAGFDPLRDEGRAYAERMRAAGVAVEHVCSEGSMHGFINLAGAVRESARLVELAADRLRVALHQRSATAFAAA